MCVRYKVYDGKDATGQVVSEGYALTNVDVDFTIKVRATIVDVILDPSTDAGRLRRRVCNQALGTGISSPTVSTTQAPLRWGEQRPHRATKLEKLALSAFRSSHVQTSQSQLERSSPEARPLLT